MEPVTVDEIVIMSLKESSIPKFRSEDSFEISGRGLVHCVRLSEEVDNFDHLIGKPVEIDGRVHTVKGVEFFGHAAPYRKGEPIGLLIKRA
jgi:hypothetical protein